MKRTPPEPLRPKARDVDWRYVAEQLGCSRALAYQHLKACAGALGRDPETTKLLRVPERFYLRDGASVDAMVRGALDELLGWLGQAPRLDLCAVDLTEPVSHPAAGIVGNGVAPDIAAHRLALVMQLLRVEQSLLARAMEPQRRVGEREDDHAALTALTSARYRWAWHVASAIETWQAAHAIAAEKRKGPTARTRPSDVRAKLVHFARDLDDAQRQLGALMAPLRERYARIRAQAEVARG